MKIAMLWFWDKASQVMPNYRDGLKAALEELVKQGHQVEWFLDKNIPLGKWDAVLFWDDSNSGFFDIVSEYKCKKGIFLTTDPQNYDNLRKLDVVYCESEPVYDAVRREGIHAIKAFGTDTDFFKPDTTIKKDIEYFYPACFSAWKKQSDIAYLGNKLLCVGTIEPDGIYELAKCLTAGVNVEKGYFPVEEILHYYQRTKRVIIPAVHGSERTVLEAMSCDIKPEVTNKENVRTNSYIKELEDSGLTPREFVLKNYSHVQYAKDIMKGLE
jgi:hypothetical protein